MIGMYSQMPHMQPVQLFKQLGAGVYFGKGLNRYSNVHIDDLVQLYVLAFDKASARLYPISDCCDLGETGAGSGAGIFFMLSQRRDVK